MEVISTPAVFIYTLVTVTPPKDKGKALSRTMMACSIYEVLRNHNLPSMNGALARSISLLIAESLKKPGYVAESYTGVMRRYEGCEKRTFVTKRKYGTPPKFEVTITNPTGSNIVRSLTLRFRPQCTVDEWTFDSAPVSLNAELGMEPWRKGEQKGDEASCSTFSSSHSSVVGAPTAPSASIIREDDISPDDSASQVGGESSRQDKRKKEKSFFKSLFSSKKDEDDENLSVPL